MSFYSNSFGDAVDLSGLEREQSIEFWRWTQVENTINPGISEKAYEVISP